MTNETYFKTPDGKRGVFFLIPVRIQQVPKPTKRINILLSDGGRSGEGFTYEKNDCCVRALAILKSWAYAQAHKFWAKRGRKPGKGAYWDSGCKDAGIERIAEITGGSVSKVLEALPKVGRFVIKVPGHVFAVVDGVPQDTFRPKARGHVRGVYRNLEEKSA